jgi:hypothetical protein
MATTAITPVRLDWNTFNVSGLTFTAATTAADGFLVDATDPDQKLVLVFLNTNASATARTATVKKGDGIQGVADLASGDIAAGAYAAVSVESGGFKITSGTNKNKILVIPSNAELKIAAIVLP